MKNNNKDTVWAMFLATGNPSFYSLYKRINNESETKQDKNLPR